MTIIIYLYTITYILITVPWQAYRQTHRPNRWIKRDEILTVHSYNDMWITAKNVGVFSKNLIEIANENKN